MLLKTGARIVSFADCGEANKKKIVSFLLLVPGVVYGDVKIFQKSLLIANLVLQCKASLIEVKLTKMTGFMTGSIWWVFKNKQPISVGV